jgi:hypothetical protein
VRLSKGLLFMAITLAGQPPAPVGIVHGRLLECDATGGSGELRIRAADNQIFRFVFDSKTYFEREQARITAVRLEKGEWLEIVSDQWPGSALRYARTVHVIEEKAPDRSPRAAARLRTYRSPAEPALPRGDRTFTGVVARLSGGRLVLHTRGGGLETVLLRPDTRYVAGGSPVDVSALEPNTRVFLRAGKNLDNQLEAYLVVWGEILEPR